MHARPQGLPLRTAAFCVASTLLLLTAPLLADEETDDRIGRLEDQVRELLDLNRKQEGTDRSDLDDEMQEYFKNLEDTTRWDEPKTFRAYWNWGLRFRSVDDRFWLAIGGRLLLDAAWYGEDDGVNDALGTSSDDWAPSLGFRQVRLDMRGRIFENVQFQWQYEFTATDKNAAFRHMWLGVKDLPNLGIVRVGKLKNPVSMEFAQSLLNVSLMERGLPNALVPGFQTGLLAMDGDFHDRIHWELGILSRGEDFGDLSIADDITARFSGLPIYDTENLQVLHLGISGGRLSPAFDTFQVSSRPESSLAPDVVDTGEFEADHAWILGLETLLILERFSFQAETIFTKYTARDLGDPLFWGGYAYVSWFLTDDHRAFWVSRPSRVEPLSYWGDGTAGTGGVELLLRYSWLDLDDGGISGGNVADWTLGVNWYLNPNTRLMANFILSDVKNAGKIRIFQMRFQIDF